MPPRTDTRSTTDTVNVLLLEAVQQRWCVCTRRSLPATQACVQMRARDLWGGEGHCIEAPLRIHQMFSGKCDSVAT